MDFAGSNYGRLAALYPAADLPFHRENFTGFDALRRTSVRGDVFAAAVASLLAPGLASDGAAAFHQALAAKWNYRPGFVSVLLSSAAAPAAVRRRAHRRPGAARRRDGAERQVHQGDPVLRRAAVHRRRRPAPGDAAAAGGAGAGHLHVRLTRVPGHGAGRALDAEHPLADRGPNGDVRQLVFDGVDRRRACRRTRRRTATRHVHVRARGRRRRPAPVADRRRADRRSRRAALGRQRRAAGRRPTRVVRRRDARLPDGPRRRGAVQRGSDRRQRPGPAGRGRITAFAPEANRAVGVALQPGRRIAFVALREPFGPYVPRTMTVTGVEDFRQHALAPWTGPMEATSATTAPSSAAASSRATARRWPAPKSGCSPFCRAAPAAADRSASRSKCADAEGRYAWDFVNSDLRAASHGHRPGTDDFRVGAVQHQPRRPADERGHRAARPRHVPGRVLAPDGRTPLPKSQVRVTSLTDHSQYGATTDAQGAFVIARIPVGNIFVEAVNVAAEGAVQLQRVHPVRRRHRHPRHRAASGRRVQQRAVKYGTLVGPRPARRRRDAGRRRAGRRLLPERQPARRRRAASGRRGAAECAVGRGDERRRRGVHASPRLPAGRLPPLRLRPAVARAGRGALHAARGQRRPSRSC